MKFAKAWGIPAKMFAALSVLLLASVTLAESETIAYQDECMGCHAGSEGDAETTGPQLGGLGEQYILRQLQDFKYGRRGTGHPAARAMSEAITKYSDQELKTIAQWASDAPSSVRFDYSSGKYSSGYQLYNAKCKGCHDSFIGRYMTGSPKLNNLDTVYIVRQLLLFDQGFRNFEEPTKHQLKMKTVIQSLTEEELASLTRFVETTSLNKGNDRNE